MLSQFDRYFIFITQILIVISFIYMYTTLLAVVIVTVIRSCLKL